MKDESSLDTFATAQAALVIGALKDAPHDLANARGVMEDIKVAICRQASQSAGNLADENLVWSFAHEMPDFDMDTLYHARASLLSLSVAVLLGWLAGGVLSTFLNFLNLGGEILRPCAILACLWLEDYLGANAKARKILLTVMGFGALARFAAAVIGGVGRLASLGGVRQLIFGTGPKPGLFKTAWLWLGAFFIYVFFAKKTTSLDLEAFRDSLETQIEARTKLMKLVFQELAIREAQIPREEDVSGEDGYCSRKDCALAKAALSLTDSLSPEQGSFLTSALKLAGYDIQDRDKKFLIWDSARYGEEYEPIGLISDGERCLILERPHRQGATLVKGRVQRVEA